MANTSALILSSGSMEQTHRHFSMQNTNFSPNSPNQSDGPIAILWDMENCPVPSDIRPEDVAGNIRMALRVHPIITGAVTMFSAYGDFNAFPRRLREGCQRTGVKLIDVPNGRKDAADKAILVDMFLFALDNPPPSSIMLISGDVDFSPALHILGQRGYTVILVIPSGVGVSSALSNAGSFVWDWPSVVRGEGFVPHPTSSRHLPLPPTTTTATAAFLMGCHQITENSDFQNEEEAIVYRGISQSYEYNNTSTSTTSRFGSYEEMWVQPGDLVGLTGQLMKLLESFGGCLPLGRLPGEYQRSFGRPLYVSEYGTLKLVNLLKKMSDKISIEGKGQRKFVYLRKCLPKNDRKGKGGGGGGGREEGGAVSSDEFSEDERVVLEEQDEGLEKFRLELQEILVSYSCRIFLGCFEAIYQQRYKRRLDLRRFGVGELEELFEKFDDVVVVVEEPSSKKKFVVAAGC